MANRIRLGIIGTSDWVELMYLTNLANRSDVEIAAIAARNPARLAEMAAKYGIAATCSLRAERRSLTLTRFAIKSR